MSEKLGVFISYKREDQSHAEELWRTLTDWGYEPWMDVKNIRSGVSPQSSTWIEAIDAGLRKCQVLIGLITPESLKSENVKNEWFWAKLASKRIMLLRLKPFEIQDMPHIFAATDYIDLHEDKSQGLTRFQRELETVTTERQDFRRAVTPTTPAPQASRQLPAYLLDKPKTKRPSWQRTLRFIGYVSVPIAFLWLLAEPSYETLLVFLGAVAALLGSFVGSGEDEDDLSQSSKLTDYEQMRKRVYQYWVQGVMQTALKEVDELGIPLDMQPDAVVRDSRRNVGDISLPNDSRHVRQVYDTFKSFLILGDPGAGKTIMLLQLAESLILSPPPTHLNAFPLVLNLSSWALDPKPLNQWLEDETWRTYRVRGGRVRGWLENNQLILLLDGLDEVKDEQRAACVDAINAFRKAHDYVPLVVCSRIKDYERLGETQLELVGAILLEELSQDQVNRYLSDPSLAHLKRVVDDDPVLQEMATTPFLLNTMIYAYRRETEAALRGFSTQAERREHLFNTYVQRRLADNPSPYSYQDTIRYLQWLATKMQAYVQTVFRLEDVQPHWLADDRRYSQIVNGIRITYAAILTLLYAVIGWQMGELLGAIGWAVLGAAIGSSIAVAQQLRVKALSEVVEDIEETISLSDDRNLIIYILLGSGIGLVLVHALDGIAPGWFSVVVVFSISGLLFSLLFMRAEFDGFSKSVEISLGTIGIGVTIGGLVWSISAALQWSIWVEAPLASLFLAFLLLHLVVFEEQSDRQVLFDDKILRRSFLGALMTFLIFGLIGTGLGLGFMLGVVVALTYGGLLNGITIIYRTALRLRLLLRQSLPMRSVRFLHAMTERQIMRQMGGGYIFIHRYLMENFAGVDEIFVLLDQVKDSRTRRNALAILERLVDKSPESTIRTLRSVVSWDLPTVDPFQRHYVIELLRRHSIELPDSRVGIGLRNDGLPDIAWCEVADGGVTLEDDAGTFEVEAFKIAKYPVTYQQYQAFVDAEDGYKNPEWRANLAADGDDWRLRDQYFKYANHPRESVNWYQAVAFCRWLTVKYRDAGLISPSEEIRLPKEWEWQLAATGGDPERVYPYGKEFDATKANAFDTGIGMTSAVGVFPDGVAPCGALDLIGNVWEWCLNEYEDVKETRVTSTNPRVVRGGSWFDFTLDSSRAGFRNWYVPNFRNYSQGFRIVCCPVLPALDR